MPVVMVYGLPGEWNFVKLTRVIKEAFAGVQELKLTPEQVSVFFLPDLSRHCDPEEVVVFVEGLTRLPERTREVRTALAASLIASLAKHMQRHIPTCRLIEVFVRQFDPNEDVVGRLVLAG